MNRHAQLDHTYRGRRKWLRFRSPRAGATHGVCYDDSACDSDSETHGKASHPMAIHQSLIDPIDVLLPELPPSLEGVRIVHLSDLHVRRNRLRHRRMVAQLERLRLDLVVLTGDYVDQPGDEPVGLEVMDRLCRAMRPRLGIYGVFGNHDTPQTRDLFTRLPVHWLNDTCHRPEGVPLEVAGFLTGMIRRPDVIATLLGLTPSRATDKPDQVSAAGETRPLRVLLSHFPTYLPAVADLSVDLMFAGHTHGGQWRLPGRRAMYNSSDLPKQLTSGLLRHRNTLCVVSRGLGETILPLRVLCPPHIPLYTLRRGPMPGRQTDHVLNIQPW